MWNVEHNLIICNLHSRKGHLQIVRYLLTECHCDPEVKSSGGRTPLHRACQWVALSTMIMTTHNCVHRVWLSTWCDSTDNSVAIHFMYCVHVICCFYPMYITAHVDAFILCSKRQTFQNTVCWLQLQAYSQRGGGGGVQLRVVLFLCQDNCFHCKLHFSIAH